jgi:putative hemolysin
MRLVRAILIALMAFSVAMPPMAMAKAHVPSSDGVLAAAQSDCCPQGQHCDKQAKDDCAKFAECMLKCSGLSALPLLPGGVAFSPSASPEMPPTTGLAPARPSTPPSPPPRA